MVNNPIGNFFNGKEYERYVSFGLDYLENYMRQTVYLYKVNKVKTDVDDLYNDPTQNNIQLDTPIDISCLIELQETKNTAYDTKNNIRIAEHGILTVTILNRTLSLLQIQIDYGDYILYAIEEDNGQTKQMVFQVVDDAKKGYENNKLWAAFRAYYKVFKCVPVDENSLKIG
jgi:hypothetical protein